MSDNTLIGSWIRRFLTDHLVGERNLSQNTLASYRDTFVLLLPFVSERSQKIVETLQVTDLDSEAVGAFLQYLEIERGCGVNSRNQRLTAIRNLAHYIAERSPEYVAWSAGLLNIPFKKSFQRTVGYLEKKEMDALLDAPDRGTDQGRRDYALLLFMYNTGARATEIAQLKTRDVSFADIPSVRIVGKGRKERYCPLWALTVETLRHLVDGRNADEPAFLNRYGRPITRFGIYFLIERCVAKAIENAPSLRDKRVSPHTVRHTTAVYLLRSGVDINTIRAWLGHVSVNTTRIYAEVDLEMKAKALTHCEIYTAEPKKLWQEKPELLGYLRSL